MDDDLQFRLIPEWERTPPPRTSFPSLISVDWWRRGTRRPVPPEVTFTKIHNGRAYGYNVTGPKWRCDVCGREGYGDPHAKSAYGHWSDSCRNGHAPCPWCGKQLSLRQDGTPRVHTRCPSRPDDAELLRLAAAEVRHDARLGVRGPLDQTTRRLLERLTTNTPPTS